MVGTRGATVVSPSHDDHRGGAAAGEDLPERYGFLAVYGEVILGLDCQDARGEPALVHRRLPPCGVEVAFASASAPAYPGHGQGEVQQVGGEAPPECGACSAETAGMGVGGGDDVLDVGFAGPLEVRPVQRP